jgi:hypothetical protein
MSAASLTRRYARALRRGVATFLGIAGLVGIGIGLLYLLADGDVPHVLQGASAPNPDVGRAVACLAAGGVCVVSAWLVRVRQPARTS